MIPTLSPRLTTGTISTERSPSASSSVDLARVAVGIAHHRLHRPWSREHACAQRIVGDREHRLAACARRSPRASRSPARRGARPRGRPSMAPSSAAISASALLEVARRACAAASRALRWTRRRSLAPTGWCSVGSESKAVGERQAADLGGDRRDLGPRLARGGRGRSPGPIARRGRRGPRARRGSRCPRRRRWRRRRWRSARTTRPAPCARRRGGCLVDSAVSILTMSGRTRDQLLEPRVAGAGIVDRDHRARARAGRRSRAASDSSSGTNSCSVISTMIPSRLPASASLDHVGAERGRADVDRQVGVERCARAARARRGSRRPRARRRARSRAPARTRRRACGRLRPGSGPAPRSR